MSNIDKRPYRAGGGDIGTGRIREIADNPYGDEEKCWLAKRVLALLDELEAKDRRIAELELKLEAADKLQDSAFRHGLQHGFSLGQTDNQAGFEECLSAYGTRGKDNG